MLKLLNQYRTLYLLLATSSVIGGFVSSILAPYVRSLGFEATHYGIFAANMAIGSLIGSLAGGFLVDAVGPVRLVLVSAVLSAVGYAIISVNGAQSIMTAALILGLAGGLGGVAFLVLVIRARGGDDNLEEPIVAHHAVSMVGTSVGMFMGWIPVIASRVADADITIAYRLALMASSVTLLLAVFTLVSRLPRVDWRRRSEEAHGSNLTEIDWSPVIRLLIANVMISFGAGLSIHIIDFYFTKKFGFDSGRLGTVMSLQNLFMGLGMLVAQKISRELGNPLKTYIIISSTSVPLLVSMTFINSPTLSSSIYIVRTFLMNVANPLYQAFELSLVPDRYRGRFLAILNVIQIVPAAVGRAIGGWLMAQDIELPLRLTALIYALAFIFLAVSFPKHSPKPGDLRRLGSMLVKTLVPFVRLQKTWEH